MAFYSYSVAIISILLEIRNRESSLLPPLWYSVATILIFYVKLEKSGRSLLIKATIMDKMNHIKEFLFQENRMFSHCLVFRPVF